MRRSFWLFLVLIALALGGCNDGSGVRARYALERLLWRAQVHERKINIGFIQASQKELELAIEAFEGVTAADPFKAGSPISWDPSTTGEIQRIVLVSKIALANLYFLSERYYDASEYYTRSLDEKSLTLDKELDVRLSLARSMYLAGEEQSLERQCEKIFTEIVESDAFWQGQFSLKEIFINIPLVLVRVYKDRNEEERFDEFSRVASNFYERVKSTWPDSLSAKQAAYAKTNLHIVREEWPLAIGELESMIAAPVDPANRWSLVLLKGELLAYAVGDDRLAMAQFQELVDGSFGGGEFARQAGLYNIGLLKLRGGKPQEGMEILKSLERAEVALPAVASKALFARALYLESTGVWDEALLLLRRIVHLYPHTPQATEAPLVITRHYVALGDRAQAERSLQQAHDYYVTLVERGSKYNGDRLMVQDFLVENYMIAGQAEDLAKLLETESGRWDEISNAGGMYRSALIYSEILHNQDEAERILKKCIELFPETRYAKIAEKQLARLQGQ